MPTGIQQSFTDEELAGVKKDLPLLRQVVVGLTNGDKIERLIARLEAAEACLKDYFEAGTVHPLLENDWRASKKAQK